MSSAKLIPEARQAIDLAEQATRVISRFIELQSENPERAWESLAELRELVDQLRVLCPARTFRTKPK